MSSCYEYELYKVIQTLQIVITKLLLMSHSYFSDMIEYLMNESSFELFQTIPSNLVTAFLFILNINSFLNWSVKSQLILSY